MAWFLAPGSLDLILSSGFCPSGFACSPQVHVASHQVLQFLLTSPKQAGRCLGCLKNEPKVWMCVHGALQWTGIPSRVYSCSSLIVPGIGSGFTAILTRIINKWLRRYHFSAFWIFLLFLFLHFCAILCLSAQDVYEHQQLEESKQPDEQLQKSDGRWWNNYKMLK